MIANCEYFTGIQILDPTVGWFAASAAGGVCITVTAATSLKVVLGLEGLEDFSLIYNNPVTGLILFGGSTTGRRRSTTHTHDDDDHGPTKSATI